LHRLPRTHIACAWSEVLLALVTPVHLPAESPLVIGSRYMLLAFPCSVRIALFSLRWRRLRGGACAID
jgi:uncharacterized protein YhhL (DUF1145 family)